MQAIHYKKNEFERFYSRCLNIYGPSKSGKSTFLKELISYFGIDMRKWKDNDSEEDFEIDYSNKHSHPLICLDFSECVVRCYDEFVRYIRKKMSSLYISLYDGVEENLNYYKSVEDYLNIVEGLCTEEELAESLKQMVYYARRSGDSWSGQSRPMIFIDEISRPLLYAAEYDFYDEAKAFYDRFLDIDHYELTAGIITTSYAPINTNIDFRLKYISDEPINRIETVAEYCLSKGIELDMDTEGTYFYGHIKYFPRSIDINTCYNEFEYECGMNSVEASDTDFTLLPEWQKFIAEKRQWIEKERKSEAERKRRDKERERAEFASPLPEGCVIPSRFACIREFDLEICDFEKYTYLNETLKRLYKKYGNKVTQRDVYYYIQKIGKKPCKHSKIKKTLEELKQLSDNRASIYRSSIDIHDSNWARFDLQKYEEEPGFSDLALVKIYLSVSDYDKMIDVFEEVTRFLIENSQHRFHAKLTYVQRLDQMCFWISRMDFFEVEKFVRKYDDILFTPLPFTAYRGKLGISREFYSWDSHNGVQSTLISSYLRLVEQIDNIDLRDMYSMYVKAWNGDLKEDHLMSQEFKNQNAQELMILLETIHVILGNGKIEDDHFLLNGNDSLWYDLGSSKNWYELGKRMMTK